MPTFGPPAPGSQEGSHQNYSEKKGGHMFVLYQVLPYVKLSVIPLIQNTQELTDLGPTLKHVQ